MAVILAGACVQSALGFGTTMITMGFLPLIMEYSKAMGLSIVMVSISTVYISVKYRDSIRWRVMLPVLIPTMIICGIVNILSAKVSSDRMYLLLGVMFVAVAVFFFVFSNRIRVKPTPKSGTILGIICGVCYGLFASGGPTAALYLLPATKGKREYLATASIVGDLDENTYPYMHQIFCAECGFPLYRRVYSNGNRVSWGCSGRNRYTKEFCSGVNVPDCVIRDWGDIPGKIYISKEVDDLGKAKFKYNRESTWKKTHKHEIWQRSRNN